MDKQRRRLERLEEFLRGLTPEEREVFDWRFNREPPATVADIAALSGRKPDQIAPIVVRLITGLQAALRD